MHNGKTARTIGLAIMLGGLVYYLNATGEIEEISGKDMIYVVAKVYTEYMEVYRKC